MNLTGRNTILSVSMACALSISACGGSGGGTNPEQVTQDTDQLIRNAATHSSKNIGLNLNSMASVAGGSTVTATLNKLRKGRSASNAFDDQSVATYDDQVNTYLLATLDGGNATRTRNGNTINIDPDEYHVCRTWFSDQHNFEISDCAAILAELSVRITATSDDTGTLSYLYGGDNLAVIHYAPTTGSYELFLPALKTLAQRTAAVTGKNNYLPETVAGALKLTASIDNTTTGEEAGSISLSVTQPVRIVSSIDKFDFSLGRSTLFSIQTDAATGNGSITASINAFDLAVENLLGADESAVTTIEMPDFTLSADIARSGTEILLSNVGMGRGPFRIAIENNDVLTVALNKFSARYNDLTREAEFFSAFNLDVAFIYSKAAFGWFGDDSSLQISASLQDETLFTEQLNGSTKVERGGPFSFQSSYIDGSGDDENFEQNILITAGQCFDESPYDERLELVSCE